MRVRSNKGKLKPNNRGVSFIELIVVVAILAVMASTAAYGVNMLVNADAKKASKNLYQEISDLRNETLAQTGIWYGELSRSSAKGQYVFTIYRRDSLGNVNQVRRQNLGSKVTIKAVGAAENVITDTQSVLLYFNQGTGTVKNVLSGVSGADLCNTSNKFYFKVESPNGASYTLTLWLNTGKISTDY